MDEKQYTAFLERKQAIKSDRLEEIHLEAAIDAQFLFDNSNKSGSESPALESAKSDQTIDRVNPNAVPNCLSPYVPTKAASIAAFLSFVQLRGCNDVLLDIGCGDGRVCAVAAKLVGCRAIGLDVSPACIESANKLAKEEGVASLCQFFQLDATTDPKQLFADFPLFASECGSVTCVWLYTYPTLLRRLVPLLGELSRANAKVVTLTYHLTEKEAQLERVDPENDLHLYNHVY